jgi:hypothetical protein
MESGGAQAWYMSKRRTKVGEEGRNVGSRIGRETETKDITFKV